MKIKNKVFQVIMAVIITLSLTISDFAPIGVQSVQTALAASVPAPTVTDKTLYVGKGSYKIKIESTSKKAIVTYSTSNKAVATVTKKGVIQPKTVGTATITVVIKQNSKKYTSKIAVTVKAQKTTTAVPTATPTPLPIYSAPQDSDKAAYLSGLELSKETGTYYTTTKEEYIQTTRFNLYLDKGIEVPVNVIELINYFMDTIEDTTGDKFYVQHYNSDKYYEGMDSELEKYFDTAKELEKVDLKNERMDIVVATVDDMEVKSYASNTGGVFLPSSSIKLLDGKGDALVHELLHVLYFQNGCSMGSHVDEGYATYYTTYISKKDTKLICIYDGYDQLKNYNKNIIQDNIEDLFVNYTEGQSNSQLGFRLINFILEEYGDDVYRKLHKKVTEECADNNKPAMGKIAEIFKSTLGEDFFKAFAIWHSKNLNKFGDKYIFDPNDWVMETFYGEVLLRKYSGNDANVFIPDTVVNIQPDVFKDCSTMVTVYIPTSVTSIGGGAFLNSTKLKEVVIPDSVTRIYVNAFEGCINLKKVVLPKGIKIIPIRTFQNCSSLTDIIIPEGVTTIENSAFYGCSSLSSIKLPSKLEEIGPLAFSNSGLTVIEIPDSVKELGSSAFQECGFLTTVKLQNGIKEIKEATFMGCKSLKTITLPEGLNIIGNSAFDFSGLTNIIIPSTVTTIEDFAFANCNLSTIEIPDSVTSIGKETFYNNPKLTIYGKKGSYAETYAESHNIKFEVKK